MFIVLNIKDVVTFTFMAFTSYTIFIYYAASFYLIMDPKTTWDIESYFYCVYSLSRFRKYEGATKIIMEVPALKNSEQHSKWLYNIFKDLPIIWGI